MTRLCLATPLVVLVLMLMGCDDAGSMQGAPASSSSDGMPPVSGVEDCGTADSKVAEADAEELFNLPDVPEFDFYLPQAEWEALQRNARDEEYVAAEGCFQGRRLGTVGLRFKGGHGSLLNCFDASGELICPRLSMKVKFNEYVEDQRFYGLKRLNFHAYYHDDSRMKEKLAYDLYRSMGIVAPRASWAVLRVNGELQGLYGMVEQIDGRFTADRWPDNPDGNLYKELWPTGIDAEEARLALKTNEETGEVAAFLAFSEAIDAASEDDLRSVLAGYMDSNYLARYMAVDDAIASYDGITYFWTDGSVSNNHNYYIYEESADRFTLIPWDVESTFWINPDHAAPHWTELPEDCSLTYDYWEGQARAPACDPVIRAMMLDLDGWRQAGQELLDGPFSVDVMTSAIDRHVEFIEAAVRADPTPTTYTTFDNAVAYLKSAVPNLRARLESLMAE